MSHSAFVPIPARGIRLLVLVAMLSLLAGSQPARAAPYVVTNNNDSGPGSLRQAITDANNSPSADTITFDPTTDGVPIVLSGPSGEDANASGDLDITGSGFRLTIQGNGPTKTIIDGGGTDRVFHICPGGGCPNAFEVILAGLTIRDGSPPDPDPGGAIRSVSGKTTVDNCVIVGSNAEHGGGIYNSSASTLKVLNGSTIGGPGVGNSAYSGGGIHNDYGTVIVDASTIVTNTAEIGGGIFNLGLLDVQNGSIIGGTGLGNKADKGGGLHNNFGTVTVKGSRFEANKATDGGGIYSMVGTLTCEDCTINDNSASDNGGGIFVKEGTVTINDSTISGNEAKNAGGIYSEDRLTITNSTIGEPGEGNVATDYGGGINNLGGVAHLEGCTVGYNRAQDGGGIYHHGGTMTLEGGSIISNTAHYGGGLLSYTQATVDGTLILRNRATADGGGIYGTATLTIKNDTIIGWPGEGNRADEQGGGIYLGGSSATVDASTIAANTAEDGGGIYVAKGEMTVTGSRILANEATANGGGLFSIRDTSGAVDVSGSCIVGNSDASFFNNQSAQQKARANWWGAPGGPNTPGADTTGGNVDTLGHLTAPILDCTPDLQVAKANNTGGTGKIGSRFAWTLTISNTGHTAATWESGQTFLVDELPSSPTYGPPTAAELTHVSGGPNVDCTIASDTLTCKASGGDVAIGASGRINIIVPVAASEVGTLTNPAGLCRVDPDGHVEEGDEGNNDCAADEVVIGAWRVYLPTVVR